MNGLLSLKCFVFEKEKRIRNSGHVGGKNLDDLCEKESWNERLKLSGGGGIKFWDATHRILRESANGLMLWCWLSTSRLGNWISSTEKETQFMTNETPPVVSDLPPALWNPNAAASWSLVFTPIFGAFIHARNATALGRADEAKANMIWFYVSIAFLVFVLVKIMIPAVPDAFARLCGMGLLLGWYFSLAKKQVKHVKDSFGGSYRRKPWMIPLLLGFAGIFAFLVIAIVVAVVAEMISPTN